MKNEKIAAILAETPELLYVMKTLVRAANMGFNAEGDVFSFWHNDIGDATLAAESLIEEAEKKISKNSA